MWRCLKCGEDVEDQFELCWNCQANRRGLRQFQNSSRSEPEDERVKAIVNRKHKPMSCLRCGCVLTHTGTRKFYQGPNLGELLIAKESLEMYVCQECGHVEFFSFGD
jgi:predicted RNA-binding Zn-ribbon protein involved in translation (DUF1610 family)